MLYRTGLFPAALCIALIWPTSAEAQRTSDDRDWPTYNCDVRGTRHNRGEAVLGPHNVGGLIEKWRFPAEGSEQQIGLIRGTPAVVNGYVYFGTTTDPTFYKLSPDGTLKWSYQNRDDAGKVRRAHLQLRPGL